MASRALVDGNGLGIVVNPSAGSDESDDAIRNLRAALPAATVVVVDDATPIDAALDSLAGVPVLGVMGGDGSINAVAERALATKRPLAVFPGGTLNHFARDAGITDPSAAIDAVRRGAVIAVDAGMIHGKPFLNTASFGMYADLVDERERLEGRLGKWAAMVVAAARILRHAEPLTVELNGTPASIWGIFIGNCEYTPPGLAPSARDRLDDGRFDVRYLDASVARSRTRLLLSLAARRASHSKVYRHMLVESLEIHSLDGPLRLARDGETFDGDVDVRVAKHDDRLVVYTPVGGA